MPEGSAAVLGMHASLLKLWKAGQDAGAEGVIGTCFCRGQFRPQ